MPPHTTHLIPSLLLACALILCACGDDGSPQDPPSTTSQTATSSGTTGSTSNPEDHPDCPKSPRDRADYFDELVCPTAFSLLAQRQENTLFSNTSSVKFVIDLEDNQNVYFFDSKKYSLHYQFCKENLDGIPGTTPVGTHGEFNINQYRRLQRRFILGTIVYYSDPNIVSLEFATGDTINASQTLFAFRHIQPRVYFGDRMVYRPISITHEQAAREELEEKIPVLYTEELFRGIRYQPLNHGETYGYLRLLDDAPVSGARPTDLVVLREAPNDIPPVAGVITQAFQTPLSHVNILSKNRGTPNMALREALSDNRLTALRDKLVYLRVEAQSFEIREASLEEAEPFWEDLRPDETFVPPLDLSVSGLPDLNTLSLDALPFIGAKAAGMAEMTRISPPLLLPQDPFAIPFAHYWEHMQRNRLDERVETLLSDPRFTTDPDWRQRELALLRQAIQNAPMDRHLLAFLSAKISERFGTEKVRFRSSTNSEDLPNFNGAGLYTSTSGSLSGTGRSIDDAVRTVWASLWSDAAVQERDFYRIDHRQVAMAILVHPSFPDEAANGVALTLNIFNPNRPGFFINVQEGEASVTNPGRGDVPDQFIMYTWYENNSVYETEYLSYSNLTEGSEPVLTPDEITTLGDTLWQIHRHFRDIYDPERRNRSFGMDVEFKLLKPDRRLLIKQARPMPSN